MSSEASLRTTMLNRSTGWRADARLAQLKVNDVSVREVAVISDGLTGTPAAETESWSTHIAMDRNNCSITNSAHVS